MVVVAVCEIMLPLIRGVMLAHLLTPEQFGIALTVTIAASILELVTDLGIGQLAIKQREHTALGTLHTVLLLRAVPLGILIAALGPVFGAIFHTPGAAWVYSIVGLSSALRGCVHLDMKRSMREHNYNGEALSSISSQLAWTFVSITAASWLHDYRAMVFGTLAATIAYVAVSHIVAKHPWRLDWHRSTASEALRYGGPLAFNGMATALANFGDRTLTGATIGVVQLAQYTALATSAFLPRSAVVKYTNSIVTAHFINAEGIASRRRTGYVWLAIVSVIASTFGIGYNLFGQVATTFVFGKAYHQPQTIISAVALLGSIRYVSLLSGPPFIGFRTHKPAGPHNGPLHVRAWNRGYTAVHLPKPRSSCSRHRARRERSIALRLNLHVQDRGNQRLDRDVRGMGPHCPAGWNNRTYLCGA